MKEFIVVFGAVFLAELADKTQLATVLFATDRRYHPVLVFLAASLALTASAALAVGLGTLAQRHLAGIPFKLIAGLGFVAIGAWMLWDYSRAT